MILRNNKEMAKVKQRRKDIYIQIQMFAKMATKLLYHVAHYARQRSCQSDVFAQSIRCQLGQGLVMKEGRKKFL